MTPRPETGDSAVPGHQVALGSTVNGVGGTVRILGAIRFFDVDGVEAELRSAGQRRLLCALALGRGELVRSEYLGEILGLAPSALRTAVSRLRSLTGDGIVTDGPGYRVDTAIDAASFQQLLDTPSIGAGRLADLDAALHLWHGEAMDEFSHEPWVNAEAARLNELRLIATEDRAELLIAFGRSDEAVAGLEAHIATHSHRDRPRGLLMQALAVEGRQAEALRAYQDYRTFLGEQTGTEPSATVQTIEQHIVLGDTDEQQEVIVALTNAGYWSPDQISPTTTATPSPDVLPTGVVTFLFTDVEGSSAFWAADAEAMAASLRVHDELLRSTIEEHGGYVFTTAGDSFAAAFDRATDAVAATSQAQDLLAGADWPGPALAVRMGVHIGETEERDGDYFGPIVNLTARLEAAGHGGQTLITEHARASANVQDTTTDLGVHHLKDVPKHVHIHQLGTTQFPDLRTVAERKTNLPATRTRLIGREEPLAQIRGLLVTNRLVTVTAVGGSGKTRLAVAVGEEELDHRSDGVWFVDLTAVMSSDDVPSAIANAMGLMLTVGDPTEQVIGFLGDKAVLLILDNCEHVVDACADFTEALLAVRGESVVLATSREALDIDGEQIVQLPSLASVSQDATSLSPAVQLFVERAQSINPSFVLDSDAQGSVESLCQHLDGMPLAIELAAARTNVLNPAELLAGLDDRFALLSGGRRRQRERTLQATLDWSYDLLEPEQQRVFRTLGVFVGGADLDAIAAVAELSRPAALDIVDALVAKSLVVRNSDGDVSRFGLLETLKAYAEDRLSYANEAAAVRDSHARHFHELAMVHGRTIGADGHLGKQLRFDKANITTAFEWLATNKQWVIAGELLLGSLATFENYGHTAEARTLVERCFEPLNNIDTDLIDHLRSSLMVSLIALDDLPACFAAAMKLRSSTGPRSRADGCAILAWISLRRDPAAAQAWLDEAAEHLELATTQQAGLNTDIATATFYGTTGYQKAYAGDYPAALAAFDQAPDLHNLHNIATGIWSTLLTQAAMCHLLLGDPASARKLAHQLPDIGNPLGGLHELGALIEFATGDFDAARHHVRRQATDAKIGRISRQCNDSILLFATLAHAEGDNDTAIDLLNQVGIGRTPGTIMYARQLATTLGIADQHATNEQAILDPANRSKPDFLGVDTAMKALHTELARRGWQ